MFSKPQIPERPWTASGGRPPSPHEEQEHKGHVKHSKRLPLYITTIYTANDKNEITTKTFTTRTEHYPSPPGTLPLTHLKTSDHIDVRAI